jgi:hypothetical protein
MGTENAQQVSIDLEVAESIFRGLSAMKHPLKSVGKTPHERSQLMRDMVKLKVAINKSQS